MSKLKLAEQPEAVRPNIRSALVAAVAALYDRNADELQQMQEASVEHSIKVSISATIDGSDTEPTVKVGFKFGRAVKDSITARCDGEDQGGFSFLDDDGREQEDEE